MSYASSSFSSTGISSNDTLLHTMMIQVLTVFVFAVVLGQIRDGNAVCANSFKSLCLCCEQNAPYTLCKSLEIPRYISGAPRYCCIPTRNLKQLNNYHNETCAHLKTNKTYQIHYACAYPPQECPQKANLTIKKQQPWLHAAKKTKPTGAKKSM